MIPTPERRRSNRLWSAAAAAVVGGLCAAAALLLVGSLPARAALLCASAALGAGAWRFGTRVWRRRVKLLAEPFPPEWDHVLAARVAFYTRLSDDEKSRFRSMVRVFLAETPIYGVTCELDETTRLLTAASAVIPVFGLPGWEYGMLREVLIYPHRFDSSFRSHARQPANTLGLVGDTGGPFNGVLILSKPDLHRGFEIHGDRHNVGIHEFAHLVDKGDGDIDGVPAGLPRECLRPWLDLVRRELIRKGTGRARLPAYAYTNEQEFLAVATECFFESPEKLAENHPELYEMLERSFRQDTRGRFAGVAKRVFGPLTRRIGRNAPCPCGSGKKYKKCCLPKRRASP